MAVFRCIFFTHSTRYEEFSSSFCDGSEKQPGKILYSKPNICSLNKEPEQKKTKQGTTLDTKKL